MLMVHSFERAWRELIRSFCVMQGIQYDAPWRKSKGC